MPPNRIAQAVILAAGASTRTYPLTIGRPKPLLPLLNKPILQHTLEQLEGLVEEVVVVVGFEQAQIRRYFGARFGSLDLTYCVQATQRGTGDALRQAMPLVRGPFLLLNGDDLVHRSDLERLTAHRCAVLGAAVPDPRPYGILELDQQGDVCRIIEKPAEFSGRPLVSTGMYLFQEDVRAAVDSLTLSDRGEYELTDVLQRLPADSRCRAVPAREYWLPIGYPWKLLEASRVLLDRHAPPPPNLAGVQVEGPVLIGEETTVEPGCTLGAGTTLGRRCHVAAGTRLINCLVMDEVAIGPDCQLEHTIVAEGSQVGANVVALGGVGAGETVHSLVKGQLIDTRLDAFGATIGRQAQVGDNCRLAPGVKVWPQVSVAAGREVSADVTGFDTRPGGR